MNTTESGLFLVYMYLSHRVFAFTIHPPLDKHEDEITLDLHTYFHFIDGDSLLNFPQTLICPVCNMYAYHVKEAKTPPA